MKAQHHLTFIMDVTKVERIETENKKKTEYKLPRINTQLNISCFIQNL